MSEEKSGRSAEGAKKAIASNEVNFEQMSIQEDSAIELKGIDANRYATKKTVAQGLLDIALLTSNASQLKYILQVGPKHEFYTLLVTLITISIILQLMVGLLFVVIGGMDLNDHDDQPSAVILNDVIVIFIFVISVVNIVISAFGIEYSNNPLVLERLKNLNIEYLKKVSAGILALLTSSLNEDNHKKMANWLYHISVGLMTGVIFCDVIKMNFGLDPALSERDHFKNVTLDTFINWISDSWFYFRHQSSAAPPPRRNFK